jgi:hypothetical protein
MKDLQIDRNHEKSERRLITNESNGIEKDLQP